CAQFRTPGTRIPAHFLMRGNHDFFRNGSAGPSRSTEFSFHDPVFERVKRDRYNTARRSDDVHRSVEKRFKTVQLIVDIDPKRLECPCRRMELSIPRTP